MERSLFILNKKRQKLAADIGEVSGSKRAAILLPGFLDSKDYGGMVGLAADLRGAGFTTIRFDATGTWASEGSPDEYSLTQRLADVDSVIAYVKESYGTTGILLAGHSMGCRVSFLAADRHPEVIGIISIMGGATMSTAVTWQKDIKKVDRRDLPGNPEQFIQYSLPYSFVEDTMRYDAMAALHRLRIPILFIAGEQDVLVPPAKIKEVYDKANEPKKFVIIPGIGHDYRKKSAEIPLVSKEALQFLKEQNL